MEWLELEKFIKNEKVLEFTRAALSLAKPEFFYIPASSSGQYHPEYALGVGGLLRHTKAAIIIANELFPIYTFTPRIQDYIISALTLHDLCKPGPLHPIEVKLVLEPLREEYGVIFDRVIPLVESHMGQWNLFGKLPVPSTPAQKFVHLCDYLASRKKISITL